MADWGSDSRVEYEAIVEDIANTLALKRPDLFGSKVNLMGENYDLAYEIARQHVFQRQDLIPAEKEAALKKVMGQQTQYSVLQKFFTGNESEKITEVMINPSGDGKPKIFVGIDGQLQYMGNDFFSSDKEVKEWAQKICQDAGRDFDEAHPIVDGWLRDGSRVSVIGFKANPLGTTVTIRKSPLRRPPMPLLKLVHYGMFPTAIMPLAELLVRGLANLGFFGRTDSGKTTAMKSFGDYFLQDDRVTVAETSFEVFFPQLLNTLNLIEVIVGGEKIVTLTDILNALLRSNPDKVICGEIRGGEIVAAANMAESAAGNFMTTGHAAWINELCARLPKMFAQGGMPLPYDQVDVQMSTMFHFLFFFDKDFKRRRVMTGMFEVTDDPNNRYREIITLDKEEFARTNGDVRRWVYQNSISKKRLADLAFHTGKSSSEFEKITDKLLYSE